MICWISLAGALLPLPWLSVCFSVGLKFYWYKTYDGSSNSLLYMTTESAFARNKKGDHARKKGEKHNQINCTTKIIAISCSAVK